jgi:hypothetical protein
MRFTIIEDFETALGGGSAAVEHWCHREVGAQS